MNFLRGVARAVGFDSSDSFDESPEFVEKLGNFKTHVNDLQKVRDAMQLYSDAAEALMAAQVVLGDSLDAYYKSSAKVAANSNIGQSKSSVPFSLSLPPCHHVARSFQQSCLEMYGHVRPAIHEVFMSRCLRPVTFILARIPDIYTSLDKRKKLIVSFNESKTQIENQRSYDSSNPNLKKNEARLNEVTVELTQLNNALDTVLDDFADARPKMLSQELAAVIACSFHQSQMYTDNISQLLPLVPQSASSLCLLQAAALTRSERRCKRNAESEKLNRIDIVVERTKVSGGRTGGYGQLSESKKVAERRKSLAFESTVVVDVAAINDKNVQDLELNIAEPIDRMHTDSAPPVKPPRPTKPHLESNNSTESDLQEATV